MVNAPRCWSALKREHTRRARFELHGPLFHLDAVFKESQHAARLDGALNRRRELQTRAFKQPRAIRNKRPHPRIRLLRPSDGQGMHLDAAHRRLASRREQITSCFMPIANDQHIAARARRKHRLRILDAPPRNGCRRRFSPANSACIGLRAAFSGSSSGFAPSCTMNESIPPELTLKLPCLLQRLFRAFLAHALRLHPPRCPAPSAPSASPAPDPPTPR
jgi:hypothetical protein